MGLEQGSENDCGNGVGLAFFFYKNSAGLGINCVGMGITR